MEDVLEVGANEPEVAEPVDTEVEATEGATTDTASNEATTSQSDEDNARYAAARRRAEEEFAQRQREQDMEFERRFKGYENPITHAPIKSQRDYFEALDAQETLKRNQELESKGIDPSMFEEMVNRQVANNPTVLQAQALMQANQEAQMHNMIDEDVKAIQKYNPNIKSIDDVFALENADAIINLVKSSNMRLADAYKLVNFDALMSQNNASAKQKAINTIKGTQHLNTTDGVTTSDDSGVDIPQNELAQWKRAFPNLSMKELKAKYNRTL